MSRKDWDDVLARIRDSNPAFPEDLLASGQRCSRTYSARELGKEKPGNWIPVYKSKDLAEWCHRTGLMPVRNGAATFFFYAGMLFLPVGSITAPGIDIREVPPVADFFPATLRSRLQRNENAFLNTAFSRGIFHHFLDRSRLSVATLALNRSPRPRLLYGQFGKIKISHEFSFQIQGGTQRICPGFQFEVDLVLESAEEIIIVEAKSGTTPTTDVSLLQLYYPLRFFRSALGDTKRIRTLFFDATTSASGEDRYKLLEVRFAQDLFDQWTVEESVEYVGVTRPAT